MTSFFQAAARQSISSLAVAGCGPNASGRNSFTSGRATQHDGDAEYHAVFATMTVLLAGGLAIVLAALGHTI